MARQEKGEKVAREIKSLVGQGSTSGLWGQWSSNKDFYLKELTPELMEKVTSNNFRIDDVPREKTEIRYIHNLRQLLNDEEWLILPDLILEFKEGCLREFEEDRLYRVEQERIEKERLAREEAECIRLKKYAAASKHLNGIFEKKYFEAEKYWKSNLSDLITSDDFKTERAKFVQNWTKSHIGIDLDLEQALSVGHVQGDALITSRAGCGKTTTLVSRAIFLQRHCNVQPDQMLLLAFNTKAAEEIVERLKKSLGEIIPHTMTFHALGYAIVHPKESILYDEPEGNRRLSRSIQSIIDGKIKSPKYFERIRSVMTAHFRADWDLIIRGHYEKEMDEFLKFKRSLINESLRGEYVKSYGEKLIADILFEHGVEYKYERNHWWSGINYRPDFTIFKTNKSGIIIEYFGLSGDPDYDKLSNNKRKYWNDKSNWELVEFSPNEISGDREDFETRIVSILREHGIKYSRLTEEEIWIQIKERAIDTFTSTVVNFVGRCRKLLICPDKLKEMIATSDMVDASEEEFLNLTCDIYREYLSKLVQTGEEDFDGLLIRAAHKIQNGITEFKRKSGGGDISNLKYLLVDEFQDFSELFWCIVKNIKDINEKIQVFAVGDDWQAINRFAGSDLKFFNKFKNYFNRPVSYTIATNYRSQRRIVQTGNALMESRGEPARSYSKESGNVTLVDLSTFEPSVLEKNKHSGDDLSPAVLRIVSKHFKPDEKFVLLARRNGVPWHIAYKNEIGVNIGGLDRLLHSLHAFMPDEMKEVVSISTAHKFKGLESTNVIVLDAVERSFPLIHPRWIFSRILGENPKIIVDDDRCLFYVAITRAIKNLFIITDQDSISPFIEDIKRAITLETIDWSEYVPFTGQSERIVVKVINREGYGKSPTFNIKELLKAANYKWHSSGWNGWAKTFVRKEFKIEHIKEEVWTKSADGIQVELVDGNEKVLSRYVIQNGVWNTV